MPIEKIVRSMKNQSNSRVQLEKHEGRFVERALDPAVERGRDHDDEGSEEEDPEHDDGKREDRKGSSRGPAGGHRLTTTHASRGKTTTTRSPWATAIFSRGEPATTRCLSRPQSTKHSKSSPRSRTNTTVPSRAFRSGRPLVDRWVSSGRIDSTTSSVTGLSPDGEHAAPHTDHAVLGDAGQEIGRSHEAGHERRGGPAVDIQGSTDLLDLPGVHHDHEVGHRHRLSLIVGDHDRRDPKLLLEETQLHLELLPEVGIQRRHWLIQEE